jgi:5'(3')-deoxyribonucleotidase
MRIYVDMDDTLCNFTGAYQLAKERFPMQAYPQAGVDFFRKLAPLSGAVEGIKELARRGHDVWILTKPSVLNPLCYTEKRLWVEDHLGLSWCERLIISPDKSLLMGDILIDDQLWVCFKGSQILFGGTSSSGDMIDWAWVLADIK